MMPGSVVAARNKNTLVINSRYQTAQIAIFQTSPWDQNQLKARTLNAITGILIKKKTPMHAQGFGLKLKNAYLPKYDASF